MSDQWSLHPDKLSEFEAYLKSKNHKILPVKGEYEALRWASEAGKPMPILFIRLKRKHYIPNGAATPFVRKFISKNKEVKNDRN